jgi:hypothetical protein
MSDRNALWGSPEQDDAVTTLVELAEDDWTDIGALVFAVGQRLPAGAPLEDFAEALGDLAGVLIDHGVVPGDLGPDPDFQPWPGTRQERVQRIIAETTELGAIPRPDDIAWFCYLPEHDPRYSCRGEG